MTIDQKEHQLAITKTKKQKSILEVIAQDGKEIAKMIYQARRQKFKETRNIRENTLELV